MDSHTCHINFGCNVCVRARGENTDMSHDHKSSRTPVIQCDYCFLKTEEDAPMMTVLVAIDKKRIRDPFASRSLTAFARYVGHPKVIIQGESGRPLVAVVHDACALLTSATPRTSPVNSKGSNGAAERAAQSVEVGARTQRLDLLAEPMLQWAVICQSHPGW